MNYSSNRPLMADPDYPAQQGALYVWSKVFTKPGVQTFAEIIDHPEAKAKAAYIWIFIAGTLSGFINGILQFVVTMGGLQEAAPELGQTPGLSEVFGAFGFLGILCGAPIAGLFSVIGFAIGVAIIHATARFFGGAGSFDKLAYTFGAVAAPFSLISAVIAPLNVIPFVAFCTLPVLLALSIYVIYLELAAIRAVYNFGWGGAVATLFLPGILIALLCGFLVLGLMSLAGPAMNEILQQLEQGMP